MRAAPRDGYWSAVDSQARASERPVLPSRQWHVPFELALACSRSEFAAIALARAARGVLPSSSALLTSSDRVLVARLDYRSGELFLPLTVQLLR